MPTMNIDKWFVDNVASYAHAIINYVVGVQFPRQCVDGYLEYYIIVLHPPIIPLIEHTDDGGSSDDVSPFPTPPYVVVDQQRLQMITIIMDNLMSLVNSDGKVYALPL